MVHGERSQVFQIDEDLSVQLLNSVVAKGQKPQLGLTIKGVRGDNVDLVMLQIQHLKSQLSIKIGFKNESLK